MKQELTENKSYQAFPLVTEGATTKRGGVVHVKQRENYMELRNKRVAVVGDYVVYPDGSTAEIISGIGVAMLLDNVPPAITQSVLDNGDVIEDSGLLFRDYEFHLYEDHEVPEGFLVENWVYEEAQ
jgi:hypothetical protein